MSKIVFGVLVGFLSIFFVSCAKKEVSQESANKCSVYKNYASAAFEVNGDMLDLVERTAKKALVKSCFKKEDESKSNLRIKIDSKQDLQTQSGLIKDEHNNTFTINITAIMLIPTEQGGLTTLTSKQDASLNLKSAQYADIGKKAEITEAELIPFVEQNVLVALNNLFKDMP